MGENIGKIVQVMGPVVDVEFEQGKLPTIYTALDITNPAINDEKGQSCRRGCPASWRQCCPNHRHGCYRRTCQRHAGKDTGNRS